MIKRPPITIARKAKDPIRAERKFIILTSVSPILVDCFWSFAVKYEPTDRLSGVGLEPCAYALLTPMFVMRINEIAKIITMNCEINDFIEKCKIIRKLYHFWLK